MSTKDKNRNKDIRYRLQRNITTHKKPVHVITQPFKGSRFKNFRKKQKSKKLKRKR